MDQAPKDEKPGKSGPLPPAAQAGFAFSGSVVGAVVVGLLIDRHFGTGPWGIVGMLFVGITGGLFTMWSALNRRD